MANRIELAKERVRALKARIELACERAGRDPSDVKILAVSKGHDVVEIKNAFEMGLGDFGENYAQEMLSKINDPQMRDLPISWHFIGHIQSNKLALIKEASVVHTLSELRHAEKLSELLPSKKIMRAFLQVNLGNESKRSGVSGDHVTEVFKQIQQIPNIDLCGLMTIAPIATSYPPAYWFSKMKSLKDELEQDLGAPVPELSMGMSSDFEDAILFGATWIRVGTLIFGERDR